MVRLLIADRMPMRLGMRSALAGEVEICAEAENAEQAIRLAKRTQPDVCLIAWELHGGGLAAVRGVARAAPSAAVIVLSEVSDVDVMLDAVRAGATGYIPGQIDFERLRKIVSAADALEAVLPRSLVRELLLEIRASGTRADGLTGREAQVLGMVRRGHGTAAIAKRLGIAPVTVRRHICEVVRKQGVEGRSELLGPSRHDPSGLSSAA